ncbi:MAG: peptidase C15 [Bacillota bacterium]|nr:peptidase C15 [Bacillota bacterium]
MEKTILVTGFAPFGPDGENPSWQAVQALDGRELTLAGENYRIRAAEVPVSWKGAFPSVKEALEVFSPHLLLMTGLSAGRSALHLERVFINVAEGKDNDGEERQGEPLVPQGPASYFSRLPLGDLRRRLLLRGIPTDISNSAGTYLCNGLGYQVLHHLEEEGLSLPAGFIHVPATPSLAAKRQLEALKEGRGSSALPSMTLETIRAGLWEVLSALLSLRQEEGIAQVP